MRQPGRIQERGQERAPLAQVERHQQRRGQQLAGIAHGRECRGLALGAQRAHGLAGARAGPHDRGVGTCRVPPDAGSLQKWRGGRQAILACGDAARSARWRGRRARPSVSRHSGGTAKPDGGSPSGAAPASRGRRARAVARCAPCRRAAAARGRARNRPVTPSALRDPSPAARRRPRTARPGGARSAPGAPPRPGGSRPRVTRTSRPESSVLAGPPTARRSRSCARCTAACRGRGRPGGGAPGGQACPRDGANTRRAGSMPRAAACPRRFDTLAGDVSSSHSTLPSTRAEDAHPGVEDGGVDLVVRVEAREHELALGQALFRPRGRGSVRSPGGRSLRLVAAGQAHDRLVEGARSAP